MKFLLSLILFLAALVHLLSPRTYLGAMPSFLPNPLFWIVFTGLCELAAAIGLQLEPLRRITACSLIVYFLAILPAHFHLALSPNPILGHQTLAGINVHTLAWCRIPLQLLFIYWAYRYTRARDTLPST